MTFLYKQKGLTILLIFVCVQLTTSAQITETKQKKIREFQVSSLIGFSAWGPKSDIEDNMISSGLGVDTGPGWLGGGGKYPDISKSPVIDLEATLFFRSAHGISVNAAIADYESVAGHNGMSFLLFSSKLTSYSLNYVFRNHNNQLNYFIGPSYMVHRIEGDENSGEYFDTINHKMGLYLGFAVHLIQKRHFFLAFKANLRLTSKSEIGPYTAVYGGSGFDQTEVNLNTLNAGVVVGVRFNKQLN